jgi:hypothetical protein
VKKFVAVVLVVLAVCSVVAVTPARAARFEVGPAIASLFLPGMGEWINGGRATSFPIGECAVGWLCFPFGISSIIDAGFGRTEEGMRFDFWTAPSKAK